MPEENGVGRTQLLDYLRHRRRYWELKEEAEDGNDSLSIEHKEETHVIFQKCVDLLVINHSQSHHEPEALIVVLKLK